MNSKEVIILDKEWVQLVKEAQTIGLSLEEVRAFLHQQEGKLVKK
ncbi:anti-repressor SinI family protein [Alkalihalobacillus sp. MEB130]|nr:anti-repressor SinI family protein [Alkalihalobacillus sp. MEB130]MDT8861923.1 anti-repressor SinI family protein [Alkalihalobacillus sp. MEB130]